MMRNLLKQKLRSRVGESFAESMVSMLIVALASVMFAGMVTASSRIIETSSKWMQKYYQAVSAINEQKGETSEVKPGNAKVYIGGNDKFETVTTYSYEVAGVEIISYVPTVQPSTSPESEPDPEP